MTIRDELNTLANLARDPFDEGLVIPASIVRQYVGAALRELDNARAAFKGTELGHDPLYVLIRDPAPVAAATPLVCDHEWVPQVFAGTDGWRCSRCGGIR